MEKKMSEMGRSFKASPIQELSKLAQRFEAINLAEGFPDFPAPMSVKAAAVSAINSDFNQYTHNEGVCELVAKKMKEMTGLVVEPSTDIAICCGQTEAFAAAVISVVDREDEVVLFDPSYETYEGCIRMAGGVPVFVELEPPYWTLNKEKFFKSFSVRTKAVILNSPLNPTGKVFCEEELEIVAEACRQRDCFAITDEVYEHITYDGVKHISLASLPEMQQRTIITSSLSKTFSVTGWRIGWAIAPASIASAIRNVHVRLTDSAPAPFQEAALTALKSPPEYYYRLRKQYESKRNFIVKLLAGVGLKIQFVPQGSFFLFAEIPDNFSLSDVEFVKKLIEQAGVVVVPGCGFFHPNSYAERKPDSQLAYQRRYIRVAFCKSEATLIAAATKLQELTEWINRNGSR